ncbi:MAG: ATP synthase F0 subunit B [Deltaproteobacteria bacterium]|nr:ATP synthase F0 subunit B [Deltaproteobacteria bacterium]
MISFLIRHKNSAFIIAGIFVFLFLSHALGFASGNGEAGTAHDSGKLIDLAYRFLNFAPLVIFLFVVFRKISIKDFFTSRRDEIRKRFDELEIKKYEVEKQYEELEIKLKEIETRKKNIIDQFKADGLLEKEKIINDAKQKAELIMQKADAKIQREIETAREKLKQEVVDVAARKAKEIIIKDIKDSDHDYMVTDFIERLEKLH